MLGLTVLTAPVSSPAWGASMSVDASKVGQVKITLGGATTINMLTNGVDGQRVTLELIQDGNGGRTVTLGTGFAWGSDITAYTNTATPNKTDYIGLVYCAASSVWRVVAIAKGY